MGMGGMCLYGIALGSSESPENWAAQFGNVDRHELAHAVLNQHYQPSTNPPALLSEGWAVAQEGYDPNERALHAMGVRRDRLGEMWPDDTMYFRRIVAPDRYQLRDDLVYNLGGSFVEFLLRQYGVNKFKRLYFLCRPATIESDFRAVYGVELNAIEREYWRDAERQVALLEERHKAMNAERQ